MIKHTNWNISEIGYSLGFEDAAHFNNFLKNTPHSPLKNIVPANLSVIKIDRVCGDQVVSKLDYYRM